MKTIYKYPLYINANNVLILAKNSKVLSCQIDEKTGKPCLWAIVDKDEDDTEKRVFVLFGTGHDLLSDGVGRLEFISTIQMLNGGLIFHLFELC